MFAKQVFDIKPAGTSSICTLPIIYPGFKNNQETIVHLPSKVKVLVVK
jgi:hypothetical protein